MYLSCAVLFLFTIESKGPPFISSNYFIDIVAIIPSSFIMTGSARFGFYPVSINLSPNICPFSNISFPHLMAPYNTIINSLHDYPLSIIISSYFLLTCYMLLTILSTYNFVNKLNLACLSNAHLFILLYMID